MTKTNSARDLEKRTISKVVWRLAPFVALMFFVNYLDRTAISFAAPNGMRDDLSLTAAQFGLASGIFFIGYILFEVPSNLALHRFGARKWLARIMVSWGIVALLFTWVSSATGLYALRFALGVAEAGFFPGAILFLSTWVPGRHRSRMLGLFYVAQPLTTVIGAPLAAILVQQHGWFFGLEGWRFMFFGVAVPAIVLGIAAWFYLDDRPADARWLDEDERRWLEHALADEDRQKTRTRGAAEGLRHALTEPKVWIYSVIYFGFIYGLYALAFFLPSIIDGFESQFGTHFGILAEGLITAVPYLPAALVLYLWSRDAGRRGTRRWHIAIPAITGGLSVPLALYMDSPAATIAVVTITACSIFAALPNFWTLPVRELQGSAAAAGLAIINTLGNLGGFSSGYVTGLLHDVSGSYVLPLFVVGGFMLLSAVLVLTALPAQDRAAFGSDAASAHP
ncbi:MFS transporter [Salinisphaera sp. SPP-AMP-43]|uniref:MFS transporter n=1 Tax=Salinisphaera sp. SPP-AMP-43 TaxID=3121288 RepID=UPI003C6E3442